MFMKLCLHQVGDPQISFANPQICGLTKFVKYAGLPQVSYGGKFADLKVCGLALLRNLRICDLRINQKKFADSHTSEICGFAIAN